jgi:hypothetical protein
MNMNSKRSGTMGELGEVKQCMSLRRKFLDNEKQWWTHGNERMSDPKERLRHTLDEGWGSNFLGANLDWFEANWILVVGLYLGP